MTAPSPSLRAWLRPVLVVGALRLLYTLLLLVSATLLPAFDTSASHLDHCPDERLTPTPPKPSWAPLARAITELNVWDTAHFTHYARCDLQYEHQAAWFPLAPLLARFLTQHVPGLAITLGTHAALVWSLIIVNVVGAALAAGYAASLARGVGDRGLGVHIIAGATVLMAFSPAAAHLSGGYTEGLFAGLSNLGVYLVLFGLGRGDGDGHGSLHYLVHSWTSWWIGVLALALASAARSNGVVAVGYLGWAGLTMLFRMLRIAGAGAGEAGAQTRRRRRGRSRMTFLWSWTWCSRSWRYLLQIAFTFVGLFGGVCCVLAPFVGLQWMGYRSFCGANQPDPRPWCADAIPSIYGYIQRTYWGNGFLTNWTSQHTGHWCLAAPMLIFSLLCVYIYAEADPRRFVTLGLVDLWRHAQGVSSSSSSCKTLQPGTVGSYVLRSDAYALLDAYWMPFMLHWLFYVVYAVLFMAPEVTTRFVAVLPVVYWWGAGMGDVGEGVIWAWFLAYNVAGLVLFPNFYPWT